MRITLRNENIPTLPKAIPSFSPCSLVPSCVAGYCNVDLQSSYLKAKSWSSVDFAQNMDSS